MTEKTFSTTDGIDILGADSSLRNQPKSDTFVGWNISWSGRIVTSKIFKKTSISLVVLNTICMAVATLPFVRNHESLEIIFDIVTAVFLTLFTIELVLQLFFLQLDFFWDGWMVFDLVIIGGAWIVAEPILALRILRLIRTFRLATKAPILRKLAITTTAVCGDFAAIVVLLLICYYIFGILFTDLYHESVPDKFGRMDKTLWTLFQIMTLDGWTVVTEELMQDVHHLSWIPVLLFLGTTYLLFLNLVTAVICEALLKPDPNDSMSVGDLYPANSNADAVLTNARLQQKVDAMASLAEGLLRRQVELEESLDSVKNVNVSSVS